MEQAEVNYPELLNEQQAAAILGLSRRTLQAWRQQKKGPGYRRIGERAVRYELESIQQFIAGTTGRV